MPGKRVLTRVRSTATTITCLTVTTFLVFADPQGSKSYARDYLYIATSSEGVKKYIADVRCSAVPSINVRKACIFWDLLVEPSGRRNEAEMILVCDNYGFGPRGASRMGQIALPGSLMAIAANRMC